MPCRQLGRKYVYVRVCSQIYIYAMHEGIWHIYIHVCILEYYICIYICIMNTYKICVYPYVKITCIQTPILNIFFTHLTIFACISFPIFICLFIHSDAPLSLPKPHLQILYSSLFFWRYWSLKMQLGLFDLS